jgi:hypothetical protein
MLPGARAKRFVDIEMVLRWAYRDELPKRERRATLPNIGGERVWSPYLFPASYGETSPMFREGVGSGPSGGFVDGRSRDPGFPRALGRPHADALLVEAAVKDLTTWRGHGFGPDDAAALMHGIERDARWSSLVNPGMPIPPEASAVHDITDDMVKDVPPIGVLLDHITRGPPALLCAHNRKFDMGFIRPAGIDWLCTYKIALWLWRTARRTRTPACVIG